jgi:hypothetical protein
MVARMDELSPEGDFSLRLAPFANRMLAQRSIAPQFTIAVKLASNWNAPKRPRLWNRSQALALAAPSATVP